MKQSRTRRAAWGLEVAALRARVARAGGKRQLRWAWRLLWVVSLLAPIALVTPASAAPAEAPPAQTTSTGVPWAWGDDSSGALGYVAPRLEGCPYTCRPRPTQVTPLERVVAISGGGYHTLARDVFGRAWAWGANADGQLGQGAFDVNPGYTPLRVPGLAGVVAVSAGGKHSLALDASGAVWAWGSNFGGELGDGTTTPRATPARVTGLSGPAVGIAAGVFMSLTVLQDGTVWAWGTNASGQLGDGTFTNRTRPVQVRGVDGIGFLATAARVAASATGDHNLAVLRDGSVVAWGGNSRGQLGLPCGSPFCSSPTPVRVGTLTGVVAVAAGLHYSLAAKQDGSVWGWGDNDLYQLGSTTPGTGACFCVTEPAAATGLAGVVAVAAGSQHSLALHQDGTVSAWGSSTSGALGTGVPSVGRLLPTVVPGLAGAQGIGAGQTFSLAVAAPSRGPIAVISPTDLYFEQPPQTVSPPATLTVANRGNQPLVITRIERRETDNSCPPPLCPGTGSDLFLIQAPALPIVVPPGGSTQIRVRYAPGNWLGGASAYLVLTHNAIQTPNAAWLHAFTVITSDLAAEVQASASEVPTGGTLSYVVRARNLGPSTAFQPVIIGTYPEGTDLVRVDYLNAICSRSGRTVICDLNYSIGAGATDQITLHLRVTAPPGTSLVGTGQVRNDDPLTSDPNPANNSASATTLVR